MTTFTSANVKFDGGTTFEIDGTHTYTSAGSDTVTIHINDEGGSTTSATTTVNVSSAFSITASGSSVSSTEGLLFNGTVATFTDTNPNVTINNLNATIDWGDGSQTSTGNITLNNGTYSVQGSHTYAEEGNNTLTIHITDSNDNTTATAMSLDTTADQAVTASTTLLNINATEGQTFTSSSLLTFTDPAGAEALTDYSATINWGDGHSDLGTITLSNGVFTVSDSHTYAEEGTFNGTITLAHDTAANTVVTLNATVADQAVTASTNSLNINATEGTAFTSSSLLTFTDPAGAEALSDYSATINWGDGHSDLGTITLSNGVFTVSDSHTYAEEGTFNGTITLAHDTAVNKVVTLNATVADQAVTPSTNSLNINATEGTAFTSSSLLTFTDPAGAEALSDYSATINWGDGHSDLGTITLSNGVFTVSDSHTYAEEGTFNGTITLAHDTAVNKVVTLNATVADAALNSTPATLSATEGVSFTAAVATFTDSDPNGTLNDYTATINWGDGSTTPATIITNSNGFTVDGTHTYLVTGAELVTVNITDQGGATTTAHSTINVSSDLSATGANISTVENTLFTKTIANFTAANPNAVLSATINWGDGTLATTGTIINNGGGSYSVQGTHTYVEDGANPVTVTITDSNANVSTTASSTDTTTESPISTTNGGNLNATEGAATTLTVATFTDPANEGTSAYTANINWGDGTTSAGLISLSNGTYSIQGTHTYLEEGSHSITTTIVDDTANATATANITIADAALHATGATTFTETQGSAFTAALATFTDADPNGTLTDYTATITWGDGTTSGATILAKPGNVFEVDGTHTYSATGAEPVTITINDQGGATTHANTTINVVAPTTLTVQGDTITPVEGHSFTGVVATIHDTNASPHLTATITWGDGSTSTGTIAAVANQTGNFTVTGTHTYAEENNNVPISVKVVDGTATATAASIANISDPSVLALPVPFVGVEGQTLTNALIGVFSDPGGSEVVADYSAVINWGDGQTSTAKIVVDSSIHGFDILGTHTYTEEGIYTPTITISHETSTSVVIHDAGVILDPAVNLTATNVNGVEGQNLTNVIVGTFTDPGGKENTSEYSATINWGDGTSSTGSIQANTTGGFNILGSHTYKDSGKFTTTVEIDHESAPDATVKGTAFITDVALTGHSVTDLGVKNMSLSGTVATFTDANPYGTPGEFLATINWGDGKTSLGTIFESSGIFYVNGTHTYTSANDFAIKVNVSDDGGSSANINSEAVIYTNNVLSSTHSFISEPSDSIHGVLQSSEFSVPQIDPLNQMMLANFNGLTDLNGLHINNVTAGTYTVSIHVDQGLLNFTSLTGLQLIFSQQPGSHGLGTLIFSGSLGDINIALSRLTYQSQQSFAQSYNLLTTDHLHISVSNGHGTIYDNEIVDLLVV